MHAPEPHSNDIATIYQYFNIKMIYIGILEMQNFIKIYSKTHQITPFPKKISEEHALKLPCQAVMQITQAQHKFTPPPLGKSCIVHMIIVNLYRSQRSNLYVKQSIKILCNLEYKVVCCLLLSYKLDCAAQIGKNFLIDVETLAMTFPRPF